VIDATDAGPLIRYGREMIDVIFLMLTIAFVIVATLAAVATTRTSPSVRGIADKVVNGSVVAALVSVALTAWFFVWPPV
jgi:hypothetical protein